MEFSKRTFFNRFRFIYIGQIFIYFPFRHSWILQFMY